MVVRRFSAALAVRVFGLEPGFNPAALPPPADTAAPDGWPTIARFWQLWGFAEAEAHTTILIRVHRCQSAADIFSPRPRGRPGSQNRNAAHFFADFS